VTQQLAEPHSLSFYDASWAANCGCAQYFDQANFGHEFRAFTGLTPTRYVEVRRRFLREHPGHVMDGWPLPAD
jgi:hypothetical protein